MSNNNLAEKIKALFGKLPMILTLIDSSGKKDKEYNFTWTVELDNVEQLFNKFTAKFYLHKGIRKTEYIRAEFNELSVRIKHTNIESLPQNDNGYRTAQQVSSQYFIHVVETGLQKDHCEFTYLILMLLNTIDWRHFSTTNALTMNYSIKTFVNEAFKICKMANDKGFTLSPQYRAMRDWLREEFEEDYQAIVCPKKNKAEKETKQTEAKQAETKQTEAKQAKTKQTEQAK